MKARRRSSGFSSTGVMTSFAGARTSRTRRRSASAHFGRTSTLPLETVQEVTVAFVACDPEQRRVVQLEALAHRETERYVTLRVVERQRDVFQAVERLGSGARVGQCRPVFQPTVERIDLGASGLGVLSRRQCSRSPLRRATRRRPGTLCRAASSVANCRMDLGDIATGNCTKAERRSSAE